MYQYDATDKEIVRHAVAQFSHYTERFLNGSLSAQDFAPLRLRYGLYKQIHAYMLRVAIPYGTLSSKQMRALANIASTYDKGYGHFTTRQNIQYNWPELTDVPKILADLAKVEMHSIQTSGNCIRNISSDHYAGVAKDEVADPRPYCEILRQWSTLHPEFYWLPRKFKLAVTGCVQDRAAIQFHDIGLQLIEQKGQLGFKVYVGGGLGRTPVIAKLLNPFLPREQLLSYTDAILRVYNLYGRRDNKYKARIKILVNDLGINTFRKKVEQTWDKNNQDLSLIAEDFTRMQAFFTAPKYLVTSDKTTKNVTRRLQLDTRFADWYKQNTLSHKVLGYRIVNIPLKQKNVAPGDISSAQMIAVAQAAERYSFNEIRTTHEQNLVLANVHQNDLLALWQHLDLHQLAVANSATIHDMICCPGLDFCSLANTTSIDIAQNIQHQFNDIAKTQSIGALKIKISGCMNACGHHHVGHIGILGVDKKGEHWYQLTIGGNASEKAQLGTRLGKAIPKAHVSEAVEQIVAVYLAQRDNDESFLQTFERIGVIPFQQKVYASTVT